MFVPEDEIHLRCIQESFIVYNIQDSIVRHHTQVTSLCGHFPRAAKSSATNGFRSFKRIPCGLLVEKVLF